MEFTTSPPATPRRQHMVSPIDTSAASPTNSFREHLRRRTSSFSSNHDRSPVTPRSRHRFSNASQLSGEFGTPVDEGGGGLGNLADELDQLDDEDTFEEGDTEGGPQCSNEEGEKDEASRDSGIDVSYRDSAKKQQSPNSVRNFSKPFTGKEKPPDEEEEDEERFSPDLEDLMNTIARMTSYTSTSEDPLIPRTIGLLQDLGNQTSLEAAAQRLTTSTNSLTSHLTTQTKNLQTLAQSLYPMFAFSAPLDPAIIEETLPLADALLKDIPQPDMVPVQKLQKLDRETADVIHALSQITDTLQMGKQNTNAAARHLRTTQTMVLELRQERERAELARHELEKSDWDEKLKNRWCGAECKDIISGFEDRCNALRGSLEEAAKPGA
ncbi:hypothetical protein PRZ48_001049 [Zasmidium cellare]|uniref:Uncharacterized protein n=1 Tax=Zasmidium cellare TaxID=395010 RepID=A0ABR0F161_ZASCE|nr:hypothetical protein PRZ48_001049 [Zasmidium cellare]